MAEDVVQDTVLAHQYATAALLDSITVSLTGSSKRGSGSIRAADSYIQDLVVPLSSSRLEIQLQQVIGSVLEQEGRINYLEQQLLQPNPTAVQQGAVNDAQTSLQNKQQAVKVRADQLARLGRHLAAHRTRSGLPGHTQQLQATWPLQAAPTYEQQAFAAAHAARGLMQLQQSRHEPILQPVQPLNLSMQWCSTPSARASLIETAYWQKVVASPGQHSSNGTRTATELGVRNGHVTAMTASPCTTKLAIGNDQGMVSVFVFATHSNMKEPACFGGNAAASGGRISGQLM